MSIRLLPPPRIRRRRLYINPRGKGVLAARPSSVPCQSPLMETPLTGTSRPLTGSPLTGTSRPNDSSSNPPPRQGGDGKDVIGGVRQRPSSAVPPRRVSRPSSAVVGEPFLGRTAAPRVSNAQKQTTSAPQPPPGGASFLSMNPPRPPTASSKPSPRRSPAAYSPSRLGMITAAPLSTKTTTMAPSTAAADSFSEKPSSVLSPSLSPSPLASSLSSSPHHVPHTLPPPSNDDDAYSDDEFVFSSSL